ncbi:hypothetical protein V1509DRAFT_190505 [Lipomyces kononenkoae]
MTRLHYSVGYVLVLITSVILVISLIPWAHDTTGGAVVNVNAAVRFVKHARRNVQSESQPVERQFQVPDRAPGQGMPRKANQGGIGWMQRTLLHDHGAPSAEDVKEKLVLESLTRRKLKSPNIKRAVNETSSVSSGSSSTISVSMTTSGGSTSSSDSTSFTSLDSSFSSLTSSNSESSRTSLPPTTSSSDIVSSSEVAASTSETLTSESPVSTSVWTSTLRNSEGSPVSTVTQTTIIYNLYPPTSSLPASSAVIAPQLQTVTAISKATHRTAGYITTIAVAAVIVGMIWLL